MLFLACAIFSLVCHISLTLQLLFLQFSPVLLSYAADNLSSFLESSTGKVLLFSILRNAVGDRSHLINSLVSLYNVTYNSEHALDDKPPHNNVRKMVTNDETGKVFCIL